MYKYKKWLLLAIKEVRKVKKEYLVLLLIPLLIAFAGCGKKKHVAPPPELEAPTDLEVEAVSYKQINLSWQDNSAIEDGFRVCCDLGGEQYQTVDTLPANTTSFEHYNLQPLTKYTYYIQAYWGEGYANSREVSATTPCPVEILDSGGYFVGHTQGAYVVVVHLKNNATERCEIGITITLFDPDGFMYSSERGTFIFGPGESRREMIWCTPYEPGTIPGYALEVTKAKILY